MNCDSIARWYRWLEYATFGPYLWRCRTQFLAETGSAKFILLLGDGDGRFLKALLFVNTFAQIAWVDSSHEMMRLAQSRTPSADLARVSFHCTDIFDWTVPPGQYDLIVTHFFLDCFSQKQIDSLVARIVVGMSTEARWIISEFNVPPRSPFRRLMSQLISLMYRIFRILTNLTVSKLANYAPALSKAAFVREQKREYLGGFLVAEVWTRVV